MKIYHYHKNEEYHKDKEIGIKFSVCDAEIPKEKLGSMKQYYCCDKNGESSKLYYLAYSDAYFANANSLFDYHFIVPSIEKTNLYMNNFKNELKDFKNDFSENFMEEEDTIFNRMKNFSLLLRLGITSDKIFFLTYSRSELFKYAIYMTESAERAIEGYYKHLKELKIVEEGL